MDPRSTTAARLNFFIYYEVDGHLQALAAVQHLRLGPRVGAPRTRAVTQVYVGFLGSRGGHAAFF